MSDKQPIEEPEAYSKEDNKGRLVLSDPVEFDGKTYEVLDLDFNKIRGRQLKDMTRDYRQAGGRSQAPTLELELCVVVSCFAAGLPPEFADELSSPDWSELGYLAQVFLNKMGSVRKLTKR